MKDKLSKTEQQRDGNIAQEANSANKGASQIAEPLEASASNLQTQKISSPYETRSKHALRICIAKPTLCASNIDSRVAEEIERRKA